MNYILAVDGSAASAKAAQWLANHMPLTAGSRVFLVYVFPLPQEAETYAHLVSFPRDPSDERIREIAEPILDIGRASLGEVEAEVLEVTLVGNPAEEIVGFATAQRADLIVTGHRGHSLRKEVVLGCVSNAIAHRALCPVLIVR